LEEHATTDPKQSTETDQSPKARRARALLRRVATHPATYAVLPLVVIAVVVAARAEYFVPRYDLAFQELAVQEAARAQRLLGPYSRFGFNHPGPLLFYANVPAYLLLGKNAGLSMILTRFVVDATCIVLMLVDRIWRRTVAWGAAAGMVWFELKAGLEWFRDPWNPYVAVLPVVLALVVGASLVDAPPGRRWRAVVLVVAGSFAVQSHLGAAPLVALALLLGVVGFVRSAWEPGARTAALVDAGVALGAGMVCWALPIWEQLAEGGNLHSVVSFATAGGDTPGFRMVVQPVVLAVTLGAGHFVDVFGAQSLAAMPRAGVLVAVVLAALLLTSAGYAAWSWRRGRTGLAALAACVPIAALVELVAATRINGALWGYLFAPALAVAALAWIVVGAATGDVLERWIRPRLARVVLAAVVVGLGGSALAVSGRAFDPPSEWFASLLVPALRNGIDTICATGRPVRLVSSSAAWSQMGEVGAALGECAPDVRFEAPLGTLVGRRRVEPSSDGDLLIVRLESPGVPGEPGWRRVAGSPEATLDARRRPELRLVP